MLSTEVLSLDATLIVELAVFVVVLAVVARFVVRPLQAAMVERRGEIEAAEENARRARELLAAAEANYEAKINEARQEARRIIAAAESMGRYLRHQSGKQGRD